MKKAIIVGATSGIGLELAKVLVHSGYCVGIIGRRLHLLEKLKSKLGENVFLQTLDVSQLDASNDLQCLIKTMGDLDLMIISAGTGSIDPLLPWNKEKETIETNVSGFTAIANVAWHYFRKKGRGHLVGLQLFVAEMLQPITPLKRLYPITSKGCGIMLPNQSFQLPSQIFSLVLLTQP